MFWGSKYRKGMNQFIARDYVNAIKNLSKAIQSEKLEKKELIHAFNMLIDSYFSIEDYDTAITVLNNALQSDDYDKSEIYFLLASSYTGKDDYETTLHYIEKAIELKPEKSKFWENKGFFLSLLNRFDDAETAYNIALKYADSSEKYQIIDRLTTLSFQRKRKIAYDLQNDKKYDDAIKIYDSILESIASNPDTSDIEAVNQIHSSILLNKGYCLHDLNRYEEAINVLKEDVNLNCHVGFNEFFQLALTHLQIEKFDDAIKYYQETEKYAPDEDTRTRILLMERLTYFQKLIQNKEYQAALAEANSTPLINDNLLEIKIVFTGLSLFYLKEYDDALTCLFPFVEDDLIDSITGNKSVHAKVYAAVGGVYYKQGQYEAALKYLNKSIQHNGERFTEIWSWVFMGESYIAIGEYEKAVEALQKAVETRKDGDDYDLAYLESRLKFAKEKLGDSTDKDGEAESLICQNCGSKVNSDDSFCGKCGRKL